MFLRKQKMQNDIDEMGNEELKDKVKILTINLLNRLNVQNTTNVILKFKYLNRNDKGLQSMFVATIDDLTYYFCISNNELQLLNDQAKIYFE